MKTQHLFPGNCRTTVFPKAHCLRKIRFAPLWTPVWREYCAILLKPFLRSVALRIRVLPLVYRSKLRVSVKRLTQVLRRILHTTQQKRTVIWVYISFRWNLVTSEMELKRVIIRIFVFCLPLNASVWNTSCHFAGNIFTLCGRFLTITAALFPYALSVLLAVSPSVSTATRSSATVVHQVTRPKTSTIPVSSIIFTDFHTIDFVGALTTANRRLCLRNISALNSNMKLSMHLDCDTYLNAHAMSMHITFSHKKAAMKANWIMKAATRTKPFRSMY